MNDERLVAVVAALLCVSAFGVAATTLDTSVSSDPGEVVEPAYSGLPFYQEEATALNEEVAAAQAEEGESPSSQPADSDATDGARSDAGEESDPPDVGGGGGGEQQDANAGDGGERQDPDAGDGGEQQDAESGGSDGSGGNGAVPDEGGLLDRLLALWPLLVLLVAGALAYRYRERIRRLLALVGGHGPAAADRWEAAPDPWADPDLSNDVERAWVTMVRAAGLSRPRTKTPGECAREAVAVGMDPDAVRTITDAYEAVRYGGAQPEDGHERRVRDGLRQLGLGGTVP